MSELHESDSEASDIEEINNTDDNEDDELCPVFIPNVFELSEKGIKLANKLKTNKRQLKTFPRGKVKFKELLEVYKNNQFYYVHNLITNKSLSVDEKLAINKLERKFVSFKETILKSATKAQRDERDIREKDKLIFGYSTYCHLKLRDFIDLNYTLSTK